MKRRVQLTRAATADLAAGQRQYDRQESGLGKEFRRVLNADLQALVGHPGVHRVVHGFHRKVSRRFPFAIFYRLEGDLIRDHAVLDCRRDPAALRRRLHGW